MSRDTSPSKKPHFQASRRILQYSRQKLTNLEDQIRSYLSSEVEVSIANWPDTYFVWLNIKNPIPDSIGFEIIETVNHVRSALDKLMVQIVLENDKGVSGVGFPFGGMGQNDSPEVFPSRRHDPLKKKLTGEQWSLLLAQKPYPTGNDTLWGINNIANAAKHGAGLVEISASLAVILDNFKLKPYVSRFSRSPEYPGDIRIMRVPSDAVGQHVAAQVVSLEGFIDFKTALRLVFSDIAPVKQNEVMSTLEDQIDLVSKIIDDFENI